MQKQNLKKSQKTGGFPQLSKEYLPKTTPNILVKGRRLNTFLLLLVPSKDNFCHHPYLIPYWKF